MTRYARAEDRKRKLESIKVHEAAHCVVASALDIPLEEVDVDGYRLGGHTVTNFAHANRIDQLAMVVAGAEAERIAFGNALPGDGGDRQIAWEIATAGTPTAEAAQRLLAEARVKAGDILRRHWPAVVALARSLNPMQTMRGDEAERIVRRTVAEIGLPNPQLSHRSALVRRVDGQKPATRKFPVTHNGALVGEIAKCGTGFNAYRGNKFIGCYPNMGAAARAI